MKKHLIGRVALLASTLLVLGGCSNPLTSLLTGDSTQASSKANDKLVDMPFSIQKYPQYYATLDGNKPKFEGSFARSVANDLKDPVSATATTNYSPLDSKGRTQSVSAIVSYPSMMFHSTSVEQRPAFPASTRVSGEYLHAHYGYDSMKTAKQWRGGRNNNRIVQLAGYRGYLYNKSHLVAWSLDGDMETHNVILGTRAQNVGINDQRNPGGMAYTETLTRNYLQAHQDEMVAYQAIPIYSGSELVPRGVHVIVQSLKNPSGLKLNVWVFNRQDGVKVNYKTGQFTLES